MSSLAYRCWTPDADLRQQTQARIVTHEGDLLRWWVVEDKVHVDLPWWEYEREVLHEHGLPLEQPAYSRLPIPYTLVPFGIRTKLNRHRIRSLRHQHRGDPAFPADPVDTSLDVFRREVWEAAAALAMAPVSDPHQRLLVLTHDLDEEWGWPGVEELRRVERDYGVTSATGVLSKRYTLSERLLGALVDEGCEVYSHGYLHDGRLPYVGRDELRRRLGHFFEVYPSLKRHVRGFRSGQLVRSPAMYEVVAEFFEYDMSPPTVELGGPHGWRTGCATTLPFTSATGLPHLPLSLPQDYFLAFIDNLSAERVAAEWIEVAEAVWRAGGIAVQLTHPDNVRRRPDLLTAYRTFLESALERGATVRLPGDLMTNLGVNA